MKLKLNNFIYVLYYHLENYIFCCDFYFMIVFGLKSTIIYIVSSLIKYQNNFHCWENLGKDKYISCFLISYRFRLISGTRENWRRMNNQGEEIWYSRFLSPYYISFVDNAK